ncbi:MAG TPA: hypothetical protein VNX70_08965 [Bryobacteraceae bacterium]|nr:hypothetical protein [Bryobacteraceae bacterium]
MPGTQPNRGLLVYVAELHFQLSNKLIYALNALFAHNASRKDRYLRIIISSSTRSFREGIRTPVR